MSMKQEEKELLLRDLCSRLPYGVKALCTEVSTNKVYEVEGVCVYHKDVPIVHLRGQGLINMPIIYIKPYLFPLSSITEEQKEEYNQSRLKDLRMLNSVLMERISGGNNFDRLVVAYNEIDWLNKNHFDYRGLIPKGLAIDATGLNIY